MERFMSKGSGVMSKDYFRQRGATVGPAPTTSVVEPMTAPTLPASASSVSVPADSGVGKSLLMFNGAGSRKASLGVGSQIMSKNHFRTLRPPKSKGIDGEGNGEPPAPTRMPSPPTLRRADTWAGSTDELPTRGDPVTPVLPDPATESGGDPGIWSSCPALTLIEKRRKEEELLDKKHQEAISLWREIEGEALDSLVLEVPSEEDDDDNDNGNDTDEKVDAGTAAAAKASEHRDHDEQQQQQQQQHGAPRPQNSDAAAALPSPAEPSQPGGEKIGRMPSTMGDEEQDVSDMTESNGVSEREDNGAGERVSKRSNAKANNNVDTELLSNSSSVSLSFVPPKPSKVSDASKSVGALPVRRGMSALPARSRKEQKEQKKLKRASVLGVTKESARAGIDDDYDDDDDVSDDDTKQSQATPRPLKKPGLYVGRFYSSLRRRAPLVHPGRTTAATATAAESESDDDKSSSSAKAEKKREKAEKKRKHKAEKKREKKGAHEKGGDNGNEQGDGDEDEDDAHLDRRGTMPKNFKMHFMEKLKGGGGETTGDEKDDHHQSSSEKKNKDKKKGKNKHNKQHTGDHSKEAVSRQSSATDARRGASVLSYSEPEPDTSGKDRINGGAGESSDGGSSGGGELKKQLKKAQKKNKAQEEKIRKQQNELERMRKELERVRRQRKERKRKETEGEKEKEKKGKKGMANEVEDGSAGREEKRKAAAKKESEDEESGSKGNNKNPNNNKKKT